MPEREEHRQQVVQIVEHASAKLLDGGPPLREPHAGDQVAALGNVGDHAERARTDAGVIAEIGPRDECPEITAVFASEPQFVRQVDSLAELCQCGCGRCLAFLVDERYQQPSPHLLRGVAEHSSQAAIHERRPAAGIDDPDSFGGSFDDAAVLFLGLPQCLFRAFPLRHIGNHAVEAKRAALCFQAHLHTFADPAMGAVRPQDAVFLMTGLTAAQSDQGPLPARLVGRVNDTPPAMNADRKEISWLAGERFDAR